MRIVGIDEVGRGCWAGPVVAGAVLLDHSISGLKDSKLLTKKQREKLAATIQVEAISYGLGWVEAPVVDEIGLTAAVRLAMEQALAAIVGVYDEIIIDGNYNFLAREPKAKTLIKADLTVPAVSAASILAKVARDAHMKEMAQKYPGYGFENHVGYGTTDHKTALETLGICELHRISYEPIQQLIAAVS